MTLIIIFIFNLFYLNSFKNYIFVNGVKLHSLNQKPIAFKRQTSFQMCLENFDVYEDKIIRTQDSRDMGAKYINERDVLSREDCLKLCCETENCDVFVFEEKSPGSCYLFECGTPEDFKCKFTKHHNYTSAVLAVNKHMSELETQIKFTQHEHELSKLREPEKSSNISPSKVIKSTTQPTGSKETLQIIPENKNSAKVCSRYQFECHTSHECIAIYNACDGIPQCADGSDEAPELGCPTQPTSKHVPQLIVVTPSSQLHQDSGLERKLEGENKVVNMHSEGQNQLQTQPAQHPQFTKNRNEEGAPVVNNNYQNINGDNQALMMQSARISYGREGEGMAYRGNEQWPYQYHQNQGGSQIFSHKGTGLMNQNERYPPHGYQENIAGNVMQYNDQVPNDFTKYNYYENSGYRMGQPNQQYNNWQGVGVHRTNEMSMPLDESMMGKNDKYSNSGLMPQDYYYDESYRGRNQAGMHRASQHSPQTGYQHIQQDNKAHMELTNLKKEKEEEIKKNIDSNTPTTVSPSTSTITAKGEKEEHHHQLSHIKFEKLTADAAFAMADIEGHNTSPSGAILSLTFGLLITGVMVVLVGCRIRTVGRRLRRGGKSYAHDADFLVNGMYL